MKRVRSSSCPDRATRDQDASQIVRFILLIPCWESQTADPEEKQELASGTACRRQRNSMIALCLMADSDGPLLGADSEANFRAD